MNAKDLLRRVLDCWDFNDDPYFDDVNGIMQEISTYLSTPSDDAEEPVAWMFPDDIERFQTEETFAQAFSVKCGSPTQGTTLPLYLHPPKPAEPEAKPVLYIKEQELLYIQVLKQEGLAQEWKSNLGFVKEAGDVGLYLHPPRPVEPEAEPLPSFLTEQEPLGGEFSRILNKHRWDLYERGGRESQIKPAEPARKPMTEEEIEQYLSTKTWPEPFKDGFDAGVRFAEKHHGIGESNDTRTPDE